jgi:arsenate reductase-like glutaredoxin family protein
MKLLYRLLLIVFIYNLTACSSSQSFNQFYNNHRNDDFVTSFQVPGYLRSFLRNASPELNDLFKNVKDFKSISFKKTTPLQSEQITSEINSITQNYTDVVRKNEGDHIALVSVKEKGDIIKTVILYNKNNDKHTILYLKGNFNPERIKELARNHEFDSLYE